MNKLEALNKLLKNAYIFGHQVGYSWYRQADVADVTGHLRDEDKLHKELQDAAAELAPLFGIKPEEMRVIMIENGWRSEDWDYIPPFIADFTKGDKD